ncbi:hypothetical protein AC062_2006 [Pasteurellaceae bacterium NI1060]|nr:hypothetical protein AC062_2006 [Pasteurellaceae bacterium NI1060]
MPNIHSAGKNNVRSKTKYHNFIKIDRTFYVENLLFQYNLANIA